MGDGNNGDSKQIQRPGNGDKGPQNQADKKVDQNKAIKDKEILDNQNVKSTFFFTGDAARLHPEVVRMVQKARHEVGCHSLYHETLGDELIPTPLPELCLRIICT